MALRAVGVSADSVGGDMGTDRDRVTWPPAVFPWAVRYDPGPKPDPVLFCRTLTEALFWMGELDDLDPVLEDRLLLEGGQ